MGGIDLGSSLGGFLNPLGGDQNIQNAAQANPEAVAQSSSATPANFLDELAQSTIGTQSDEDGQVPSFLKNLMPDAPSLPPALSSLSGLKDSASSLFQDPMQPLQQLMGSLSPQLSQGLEMNSLMGGMDPIMNGLSSTLQSVASASSMATNMLTGMVPGMQNIGESLQGLGLPSPGPISSTASPAEQQSQLAANNVAVLGNFNEISQASLNGMPEGASKDALSSFLAPFTQALSGLGMPDLGSVGDIAKNSLSSIGGDSKEGLSNLGGGIKDGWASMGSDAKDGIKDTAGSIGDTWKGIGSDAKDGVTDTFGSIKDSYKDMGSDLKDGAKGTLDGITDGWKGIGEGLKNGDLGGVASALKDGVVNTNSAALGTVGNVVMDYGKGVVDMAKTAGGATVDVAKGYGGGVIDTAKTAGGATVDVAKEYGEGVSDIGGSVFDSTKQVAGDSMGGLGQMFGGLGFGAPIGQDLFGTGNMMESLTGGLSGMLGGSQSSALAGDPISSLTSSIGSTLTGALSPLLSLTNMFTGNSSALMGGNPLSGGNNMLGDLFGGEGLSQAFQSIMNPMTALCGNLPLMGDLFGSGQQTPEQLEGMASATSAVVNEGGQHLAQLLGAGDNANLIGQSQTLIQQMMAGQHGAGDAVQPQIMNTLEAMTNGGTATGMAGQFNEAFAAGASGDMTAMMQNLEQSLSGLGMDPSMLTTLYDSVNQNIPTALTSQTTAMPTFFGSA